MVRGESEETRAEDEAWERSGRGFETMKDDGENAKKVGCLRCRKEAVPTLVPIFVKS